ncbi:ABC transporter permease [Clostridium aminobutyricum]|uniref:FtsX-like permease family protein n=1 Tax=Clostridium aminobutyricum TaxID=33953 RepID=A0A939DA46_CLOAM|nr:FtsX-like permease family protein [Clostridium aminobutyricum]MBN7773915.1 FtsX-like permease family protein [Clostridium aminobutyricum]
MIIFMKKFLRDLKESKGQFVSVLAVVIIGVMFYTGMYSALEGLSGAGHEYFTEYRLADLWSTVYRAPEGAVKRIEEIPGVKMSEGRVVQDVRISMEDKNAMVRLISLPDKKRDIVNDIMMKSGSYFSANEGNQCIVSEDFFKANHMTIGQTIEPIINGERVKLSIVGTAKSPEYIYEIRDAAELFPDHEKFGVVYVKKSYLQTILDFRGSVNDISVLLDRDGDINKVKDGMKKILDQYGLTSTVERKDQTSYAMFHSDETGLKSMAAIFPMLFFIASAAIIYITMTRMIENQRTLMGVLKALGYSDWNIMLHYQTYPLLVGVLGSIVGSLIGIVFIGKGLLNIFNAFYNLPTEHLPIHLGIVVPASLMALFFCVFAGYNACRKELRPVPAESMRPKPPASGRKILLENLRFFWGRINFSWKIIFRNLFRYKRRSVMASTGIIFSMALLLIALGFRSSMDYVMEVQYEEIQKFDLKITLTQMMDTDELSYIRSLDHVESVEPVMETGMEIANGWKKKDIGVLALDRESKLYGVYDRSGNPAILPQDGILLPVRLMETMGLHTGDQVTLRSYYPGKSEEKNKKTVTVKGETSQFIGQSAVCSMDYVDYLLEEGVVANAAHIRLDDPKYEKEVIDKLKDILTISTIQSKSEVVANTSKQLQSMNTIILFMMSGASILAIAVIYNITNINIFERRREIATLSVLGFTSAELKSLVFNENFFISAFGMLIGIPMGRILAELAIGTQATDSMQMPLIMEPSNYLIAAFLLMTFTAMANFLLRNKITSINMVESLKSAE